MIESIHFRETKNSFQNKLKCNINKINNDNHLFVSSDTTSNFYRIKLRTTKHKSVKAYKMSIKKKLSAAAVWEVTKEGKRIAKKLELSNRINVISKSEAFITLKDHKPNVRDEPTSRLINPCKLDCCRISKEILKTLCVL